MNATLCAILLPHETKSFSSLRNAKPRPSKFLIKSLYLKRMPLLSLASGISAATYCIAKEINLLHHNVLCKLFKVVQELIHNMYVFLLPTHRIKLVSSNISALVQLSSIRVISNLCSPLLKHRIDNL